MTELRGDLPGRSWRRIYRVTGLIVAIAIVLSVIISNMMSHILSTGFTLEGLVLSIVMPVVLGTPVLFVVVLKQEQLRQANLQLEHMAMTDWLTDCLNRRAFTAAVTAQLQRQTLDKGALLIIDADEFKSVNDRFGHHNGDVALRLIALAIKRSVGNADLVCRLGGEEFGVFLSNADSATADATAERIRRAVADSPFFPDDKPCPLSVSIGGATYAGRTEFADLYRLADNRLYQAKNTGRDRVAIMQAA